MEKHMENGVAHKEMLHDHDVLGKDVTREEAMHFGALTEEELVIEKKLRRKIDALVMPIVVSVYLMNYIDRNNYAAAKLQGLVEELDMTPDQYQTGLSILFVGYVLMQVPSNAVLNYVGRPSWYIGFFTLLWGLVSLVTSQVQSYKSIIGARFVLGLVEAPFFPGVLFYLSKWYTKSELNFRMALFYSGSLVSGAFGSLIAAGILSGLNGARGLSAWRWLYIIEGAITMALGVVVIFFLPDFPDTWKRLSPEERRVANRRLAIDAAEADVDVGGAMSQLQGIKLAFTDPKTYFLEAIINGSALTSPTNFFPTLTRTLGFDNIPSLLLCAPPYIFMVFWSLGHSHMSDKLGNRFWFYMYPVPIVLVGCFLFMFTNSFGARYFSLFLLVFIFAMNGTIYAWIANSIPRPPAKRAAALAFINSVGNAASIWTSPHYIPAMGIIVGLTVVAAICGFILRTMLVRDNKMLERMDGQDTELTEKDLKRLRKTAEVEGIDIAAARQLQKGYRYLI
ncbi:hypothetical protein B0A48_14486 [Cryoendolithus antarcticus]|uniref:Major facilitator superfamily (MFS) profile domain-containing protein n=1 Tax=Cryoendolithus antarcticus TaxID=1507870 RepID=A0A1V8SKM0_9PEZI|nr:hypothetical protein B0A48_14486 [Cryoendolithus antarcticus]